MVIDRAPAWARVIDGLLPGALQGTGQCANSRVESDHGRLGARLRPMRGLKTNLASSVVRGHALVQNLWRGHYELGTDTTPALRLAMASTICRWRSDSAIVDDDPTRPTIDQRSSANEFKGAVISEESEFSTTWLVRHWFVEHVPTFAGAVTGDAR